jgi:hypothetical protein
MRAILCAKFSDDPATLSVRPDSVSPAQPDPQLRDISIDEFEAALTKARDAWQGRGPRSSPTATYSSRVVRHR